MRPDVYSGAPMNIAAISNIAGVRCRPPEMKDGRVLYALAKAVGTLDVNTPYAYLLPGLHHGEASLLAETDGNPAGFIYGYWIPSNAIPRPDAPGKRLFVWQIGVHPDARGQGLGRSMLLSLVAREANRQVRYIETTITPSNTASQRLFQSTADRLGAPMQAVAELKADMFDASHEAETLYRIGPFDPTLLNQKQL